MLLAADVGGTKTQLALYAFTGPVRPKALRTYPTRSFRGLVSLLKAYLTEVGAEVRAMSLAVAGPVIKGRVHLVNVGWRFSEASLRRALGVSQVRLLNDLEALAFAVPHLSKGYLIPLNPGRRDPRGNVGVIAAGTGLGQAMLIQKGLALPVPVATEAGHAEFAPGDEREWALYRWLAQQFGHVSLERVISGPGIENIYRFLCEEEGVSPRFFQAKEISEAALSGSDPLAEEAMRLFVRAYAREAGNLALRCLATGGIFLGGGIAPKVLPLLKEGPFLQAFCDKGRLSDFVTRVPVYVITHPCPTLLGAALYGRLHLKPG